MNFFRRLFGRSKARETSQPRGIEAGERMMLRVDTDNLGKEVQQAIWEEISKKTNLPIYEGRVEHGYSRTAVSQSGQCPRCYAKTQQRCANFIYATDIAPRVMFAPAGFFCTGCPTVIIDEEMIEAGVKKGYTFQGVVGIDYERKKEPDYFRTWNGNDTVYLFDENNNVVGLAAINPKECYHGASHGLAKNREKLKRKRKIAKEARKRNRKK